MPPLNRLRTLGGLRGRALSGSASISQTPPYTTGLLVHIAPWSRCPASTDLTGANVADGVACGSVENLAVGANYLNQTTGGSQPLRQAVGDYSYFEFDGVDDFLSSQSALTGSAWWSVGIMRPAEDATYAEVFTTAANLGMAAAGGLGLIHSKAGAGIGAQNDTLQMFSRAAGGNAVTSAGKASSYTAAWRVVDCGYGGSDDQFYGIDGTQQTPFDKAGCTGTGAYASSAQMLTVGGPTYDCPLQLASLLIFDHLPSLANRNSLIAWCQSWQSQLALSG